MDFWILVNVSDFNVLDCGVVVREWSWCEFQELLWPGKENVVLLFIVIFFGAGGGDLIYKCVGMFIWFVGSHLIMGIFLKFLWWKCWFFLVQYFSDGEINKSWNFCFIRTLSLIVEFWILVSVNISYAEMNETQILISFGCCLFLKPD